MAKKTKAVNKEKKKRFNSYALTSFILALCCILPAINIILSVLAVVFGIVGLKEIKQDPTQKGKGIAIAGVTVGIVVFLGFVVGTILYFVNPDILGIQKP